MAEAKPTTENSEQEQPKHPGGRPLLFQTVAELDRAIQNYFAEQNPHAYFEAESKLEEVRLLLKKRLHDMDRMREVIVEKLKRVDDLQEFSSRIEKIGADLEQRRDA